MSLAESLTKILIKARAEYVSVMKNDLLVEGFKIIKFENELGEDMDFFYSKIYVKYRNNNFRIDLSHSGATFNIDVLPTSSTSAANLAKKLDKYLSGK